MFGTQIFIFYFIDSPISTFNYWRLKASFQLAPNSSEWLSPFSELDIIYSNCDSYDPLKHGLAEEKQHHSYCAHRAASDLSLRSALGCKEGPYFTQKQKPKFRNLMSSFRTIAEGWSQDLTWDLSSICFIYFIIVYRQILGVTTSISPISDNFYLHTLVFHPIPTCLTTLFSYCFVSEGYLPYVTSSLLFLWQGFLKTKAYLLAVHLSSSRTPAQPSDWNHRALSSTACGSGIWAPGLLLVWQMSHFPRPFVLFS